MTPSFSKVLKDAIEERLLDVHTTIVARVTKVDVAKGMCDAQPVIKRKYADGEVVELPVISNVPIANYRAGNAFISLPVKVGDYVELRISERSLDVWLEKGGVVDPLDPRKFNLTDAIAYPGVYPFTMPPEGATADDIIIRNGSSKITVKPDGVIALGGESDAIALASKVLTELENIKTAFDNHTHLYNPGPSAPAPSQTPAVPMTAPQPVASEKVKAI